MLMHAIAHEVSTDTVRESALKVDSGRKIPCSTGESNLHWQHASPMLYQLSYIPTQHWIVTVPVRITLCTCVEGG